MWYSNSATRRFGPAKAPATIAVGAQQTQQRDAKGPLGYDVSVFLLTRAHGKVSCAYRGSRSFLPYINLPQVGGPYRVTLVWCDAKRGPSTGMQAGQWGNRKRSRACFLSANSHSRMATIRKRQCRSAVCFVGFNRTLGAVDSEGQSDAAFSPAWPGRRRDRPKSVQQNSLKIELTRLAYATGWVTRQCLPALHIYGRGS
jgi:hypothetical protein